MSHTFHIPVLGLGYSIDTPLKVSKYGVSSVLSIVDDELVERMREYHSNQNGRVFNSISKIETDSRSKRITAYLNFLSTEITTQFELLRQQEFIKGNDICRYFELLPESSKLKAGYELMMDYPEGDSKKIFQDILRKGMKLGAVDVNIMAKVDKMNFVNDEYTGDMNTDALAALRGFAESNLHSSVILSAGMNPRLYSYIESFEDFLPNKDAELNKKIILKVSDFRSALIQAKFLAKKGLWVSEFRIESGLNCGGHAFATEGYLLGPILEEFKVKKKDMLVELFGIYQSALTQKGISLTNKPAQRISVQGGIGTAAEHEFLLNHYQLDAAGWGSPFLLVPEVTNVDNATLKQLTFSKESDFYLSGSSPLGIQFNNFKNSSIDALRLKRIEQGRPGSPCTKKYLVSNTEFTTAPICTASREYQHKKIKSLKAAELTEQEYEKQYNAVVEKVCLCEGLTSATYIKYNISKPKENKAVAICPGPNLAYFSKVYSFDEMVGHIYGKVDLLTKIERPHFFIKELNLYIDYLQNELQQHLQNFNDKKKKQLNNFKFQLTEGVNYYKQLFNEVADHASVQVKDLYDQLAISKVKLDSIIID
ncbi:hypothetical protein EZJ43_08980 [Pedobacter changchengzhani]|uniref:Uncharacterized protein n=1 Tax=Pedobacter changchengzhani TaxID=2529274 RepID=A0A4R5MLJ4_9SPHI|nr:hypothetical protein [Pedobacter changchengzhani]TDG36627.1 hypothetical protein EZJ43_08980 [Pedobacter changchengzhani]